MNIISKKLKTILILFLLLLFVSYLIFKEETQKEEIYENTESEEIEELRNTENAFKCPIPEKEFEDMKFVYVGQESKLKDIEYVPKNLVPLSEEIATHTNICMEYESLKAFIKMAEDARKEDIFIKIVSGYRSYETQKYILDDRINKNPESAHVFVAKPGHSEHQLGTTIDVSGRSINYDFENASFDGTIEAKWLEQNSYKYGFVMSYPKDKRSITGYGYEPWHYRYIGIENAKYIFENNLTLTEFLQ